MPALGDWISFSHFWNHQTCMWYMHVHVCKQNTCIIKSKILNVFRYALDAGNQDLGFSTEQSPSLPIIFLTGKSKLHSNKDNILSYKWKEKITWWRLNVCAKMHFKYVNKKISCVTRRQIFILLPHVPLCLHLLQRKVLYLLFKTQLLIEKAIWTLKHITHLTCNFFSCNYFWNYILII